MPNAIFAIAKYVLLSVITLIIVSIGLGLLYRTYRQHLAEQSWNIHTANGIQEGMYVTIGGIEQWLQIRGEDQNNPVLLFVHGGPGASTLPLSSKWQPWEKYFTIVQWDQRGAGRTYRKTGDAIEPTMTVEQMTQDGIEVTEFLRTYLHKDKVILVGHSWGSFLSVHMINKRPDLFVACVGAALMVGTPTVKTMVKNERARLLTLAQDANEVEALKELASVDALPWDDERRHVVFQKWSRQLKLPPADYGRASENLSPLWMPGFTLTDWYYYFRGLRLSWKQLAGLHGLMAKNDLRSLGLEFSVPIFFFEGTLDSMTPIEPAEQYFEAIKAPHKEFIRFDGANHFFPFNRPDAFFKELLVHVRPLAENPLTN